MKKTNWQLFRFTFVFFNSQATVFLISALTSSSNYQGWLGIVLGSLLSIIIILCLVFIDKYSRHTPWIQFGKHVFGKWIHFFFITLLLLWCIYYASYDIQSFVLFFGVNYLRETPFWFLQLIISLAILFIIRLGISTIIYIADGMFILIFITLFLLFYLFTFDINLDMIPAFYHYHDPKLIFTDSLTVLSWVGEWVVFLFILPEIQMKKGIFKNLFIGQITISCMVFFGWLLTLLNFGPELAKSFQIPYLEMIRSIDTNNLLAKIDPLLIGVWTSSMLIHSSCLLFAAYKCILYLSKNKGNNFIPFFVVALSNVIALYYVKHITTYQEHFYSFNLVLVWLIVELIPLYYLLGMVLKRKKLFIKSRKKETS
ncbi:hypothetical protein SAFG77S_07265 [Streptomyces afghaniensis]|uniref:GerAB/ArcD/ProY family transporter n=1 Tax=Niallia circulans TaxID=1397 RepID=UPI003D987970